MKVHIGDRTLTMHSIEAMAYKLVQKALGDIKAVKAVIELGGLDQSFADAAAQGAATMRAEDLHLLRRALERGGGQSPVPPDPSKSNLCKRRVSDDTCGTRSSRAC